MSVMDRAPGRRCMLACLHQSWNCMMLGDVFTCTTHSCVMNRQTDIRTDGMDHCMSAVLFKRHKKVYVFVFAKYVNTVYKLKCWHVFYRTPSRYQIYFLFSKYFSDYRSAYAICDLKAIHLILILIVSMLCHLQFQTWLFCYIYCKHATTCTEVRVTAIKYTVKLTIL